jgi:starch phosphorylase
MNGSMRPASRRLPSVAYFSMEVGLEPSMPTYSGGLGILAGDTLRTAADLDLPLVGVTLLHRKGYFRQHLDARGNQSEEPLAWSPENYLEPLEPRASVTIEGRSVQLRAWRYLVRGASRHAVPVYLLDAALEANSPWDRTLTDYLYGGDQRYRLCQEMLLGVGGVAMLRALGHERIQTYHMNEGHSALLVLGLLAEQAGGQPVREVTPAAREAVRRQCIFTTHTPVPAGQDQFPVDLVRRVLGEELTRALSSAECCMNNMLNMTYLALFFSHYINGVAMRHGEISRDMFPRYPINSITNGVHAATWASAPFQRLYDRHFPEWRRDNLYLRYAVSITVGEILQAHAEAKQQMLAQVEERTGARLDSGVLTLGFARRATAYKRPDLVFSDLERLRRIAGQAGPLQVLFAGKAHPRDEGGKTLIRRIFEAAEALKDSVQVVYLEEYDMALARYLCSGVDVWLNTPHKPEEASGTSGMKAALNGVPSLSILDGWWVEGHLEGTTGWAIGEDGSKPSDRTLEATSLYDKLEYVVCPLFYRRPMAFAEVMRSTIALNGAFFNAQRMMVQYLQNAYLPTSPLVETAVETLSRAHSAEFGPTARETTRGGG